MIGTRYRQMAEAMQARVVGVIAERLAVALAARLRLRRQGILRRGCRLVSLDAEDDLGGLHEGGHGLSPD